MMQKHVCYILLCFFTLLASAFGYAQQATNSAAVSKNLDSAISSFQLKDSLFLSKDFKSEIKIAYLKKLASFKTESTSEEIKKSVLDFTHPKAMEQVIREYVSNTDEQAGKVFSLEDILGHRIYYNVPNEFAGAPSDSIVMPAPMIVMSGVPNKYATLLMQMEPVNDNAALYLNGELICLLFKAKNGIRVHSNKLYAVEVRSGNRKICSKQVTFARQEKREIKCRP